jgi:hypothetical protein
VISVQHGKLPVKADGIHFNTEGQLRLGMMTAAAIKTYYAAE